MPRPALEPWECLKCSAHFDADRVVLKSRAGAVSLAAGLCPSCRPHLDEWVRECDELGGIERDGIRGEVVERVCTRCGVHHLVPSRSRWSGFCPVCIARADHREWQAARSATIQERASWIATLSVIAAIVLPLVAARVLPQGAVGFYGATITFWVVAGIGYWLHARTCRPVS